MFWSNSKLVAGKSCAMARASPAQLTLSPPVAGAAIKTTINSNVCISLIYRQSEILSTG